MLVNISLFQTIGGSDPVRMGAQVISGIGFLGAGAILVTRNHQVRGLTTAAGLWASAIIGMAFGSGYYTGGFICFLSIYISLRFLAKIDTQINRAPKTAYFYCELAKRKDVSNLIQFANTNSMRSSNMEINSLTKEISEDIAVIFTLHLGGKKQLKELLIELGVIKAVSFVAQV